MQVLMKHMKQRRALNKHNWRKVQIVQQIIRQLIVISIKHIYIRCILFVDLRLAKLKIFLILFIGFAGAL